MVMMLMMFGHIGRNWIVKELGDTESCRREQVKVRRNDSVHLSVDVCPRTDARGFSVIKTRGTSTLVRWKTGNPSTNVLIFEREYERLQPLE